jgi:3-hydroxyisobutyrate dehydrogenase-like beta-hydroxyacid dehydrogenase
LYSCFETRRKAHRNGEYIEQNAYQSLTNSRTSSPAHRTQPNRIGAYSVSMLNNLHTQFDGKIMKVGFCGLGNMGFGMASRIQTWLSTQDQYHSSLIVWNRTKKDGPAGSTVVDDVAEIAKTCSLVFSSLRDDTALEEVVGAFLKGVDKSLFPQVFCDCSTVSPVTVEKVVKMCDGVGVKYVSAQVLGRPDASAAGKLLFLLGSSDTKSKFWVKDFVKTVPIARAVLDVGEVSNAPTLKLVANNMILGSIELLAEALTLADANGVSRQAFQSLIQDPLFGSIVMSGYGMRMSNNEFDATGGFPVTTALKDAKLMKQLATKSHVVMPILDTSIHHLEDCVAKDRGYLDWNSIVTSVREEANRNPEC